VRLPGVLRNPVPVEALYDRRAAHRVTLRNLLQRQGYENLDAVRAEGVAQASSPFSNRAGSSPTRTPGGVEIVSLLDRVRTCRPGRACR
jgi:hypothetical protein